MLTSPVLSPEALAEGLRVIGAERYHILHPFHRLLHEGRLDRGQVQAWALNRYYYQASIPVKDATLLARLPTPDLRREWRRRLVDHDGDAPGTGGVVRWLKLAEGVGLDRDYVESGAGILPTTRFAVDAYVAFVRDRSVLEAVASSLTEMFSPKIIAERVSGMLAHYDWITRDTLAYFTPRLTQAPRDSDFALAYVQQHARTATEQQAVLAALRFKCDVLWAQLDALHHAYVAPALPPPRGVRTAARMTPRFCRGHKFRFDQVRDAWVLLGPERMFVPDEHAVEVLKLVDGVRTVDGIVTDLAARYDASPEAIRADIDTMLNDLSARGAIRL